MPSAAPQPQNTPPQPPPWRRAFWPLLSGLAAFLAWFSFSAIQRILKPATDPADRLHDFYEFFAGSQALSRGISPYLSSIGKAGYIYPPLLAFLLQPLTNLDISAAGLIWLTINLAALCLSTWLTASDITSRLGRADKQILRLAVMLIAVAIMCDSLRSEFRMGQTQMLLTLCWVLGLRWMDRRPLLAGLALGFAANLKYFTLAAVPYLLIRRRWKAAAATLVCSVLWALLPAVQLGWHTNLDYLNQAFGGLIKMVAPQSAPPDAARVQSLDGIVSCSIPSMAVRYLGAPPPPERRGQPRSLTPQAIALVVAIFAAFVTTVVLMYRRAGVPLFRAPVPSSASPAPRSPLTAVEWAGLLVTVFAFGPQTNPRHLAMLLPMAICMSAYALIPLRTIPRWPIIAAILILAFSLDFPPGNLAEATRRAWHNAASPIWGMLVAYLLLLWTALQSSAQSCRPECAVPLGRRRGGVPL